ncbi:MAG TPA: orotidine-5'-phosphate decarboxylase [Acidimicrobiales bacterium]|nr:orotidine-5'-phosphate decarboxylase [Acidimicrobiales bacterium]
MADVGERLALALDMDDLVAALRLARRVRPWFGVAKVGLELFSAEGPEAVVALKAEGYRVFLDLKLHDIPTTVNRAARVIGGMGVAYTTVHTAGGAAMVSAAVEGMAAGASAAGVAAPSVLGVTVLTSEVDAPAHVLRDRAALAAAAGCAGVVCAATDLAEIRRASSALITVVPGIRPAGVAADDQARAASPGAAIGAGADILVIGRAVSGASDPEGVAGAIAEEVGTAVQARG